ncbi:ATP-grasp domain-containing protein [Actinomadura welshii]
MSRLMMVGCGWMGRPYLRRARDRGMRVAVLDRTRGLEWAKDALGPRDQGYPITGEGTEAWQAAAAKALADGPVDAVLAFSEQHVVTAARLAGELRLPGPGLRAALTSRNKYLQRDLFGRHKLPQPEHQLCYQLEQALEWAAPRFPVVAKPLTGMGSEGVEIVQDDIMLKSWFERHPADPPFLVERYLSGPEFSMEAIVDRGEIAFHGLTEKTTTDPPFCVEVAHRFPAALPAAERGAARDVLAGVVRALDVGSGIVHLELRMEPGGPHIMEVAVRTPGDNIMDMVEAATGFDLYDAAIAVARGEPAPRPAGSPGAAAVWFPTPPPGVVTAIDGADRVAGLAGVADMEIDVEVGGTVPPLRSSLDRIGMVLVRAGTRDVLERRLRAVREELRFTVRPAEGEASA